MNRRFSDAAKRYAERKTREDEAPRLRATVPALATLRLEIQEQRAGAAAPEPGHVRHVVVDNAPALFFIPCGEPACRDGGHDVTDAILRSVRSRETRFEGDDRCMGTTGTADCARVLHYIATATYKS